jgi:hypothetical protein
MILLDKEDVVRLNLWTYPFYRRWDHNDPEDWAEGTRLDFPDILAEGPFLLVVHDEHAWAGQKDPSYEVAGRRVDPPNFRWWAALADLYAESMGISRLSMLRRYKSMRRYLLGDRRGRWCPWEEAYHWPDKDDLAWSALVHGRHPWLEVREHGGKREVMYRDNPR